jgi:hypothetical protein
MHNCATSAAVYINALQGTYELWHRHDALTQPLFTTVELSCGVAVN